MAESNERMRTKRAPNNRPSVAVHQANNAAQASTAAAKPKANFQSTRGSPPNVAITAPPTAANHRIAVGEAMARLAPVNNNPRESYGCGWLVPASSVLGWSDSRIVLQAS